MSLLAANQSLKVLRSSATRPSSEPAFLRLIVDRQTRVKTLPSLAVVMNTKHQAPGKDLGRFSLWPIAA